MTPLQPPKGSPFNSLGIPDKDGKVRGMYAPRIEADKELDEILDKAFDRAYQHGTRRATTKTALLAWRDKAVVAELENLKKQTMETTHPDAHIDDRNIAQSIRVHTNSLIENRLSQLNGAKDE